MLNEELQKLTQKLSVEEKQKKYMEDELYKLKKMVADYSNDIEVGNLVSWLNYHILEMCISSFLCFNILQDKSLIMKENNGKVHPGLGNSMSMGKSFQQREAMPRVSKIFEEGMIKINF